MLKTQSLGVALRIPATDKDWYAKLGLKILCLGSEVASAGEGDKAELHDDKHITHYDFFAIDNSAVDAVFKDDKGQLAVEVSHSQFEYIESVFTRRLNEILKVCEAGSSILVFYDRHIPTFTTRTGGTLTLRELPIFNLTRTRWLEGSDYIETDPSFALSQLRKVRVSYCVEFQGDRLQALMQTPSKVKNGNRTIAGYIRPFPKGGVILFCPSVLRVTMSARGIDPNEAFKLWINVAKELAERGNERELPAWTTSFNLSLEHRVRRELLQKKLDVAKLQEEIAAGEGALSDTNWVKYLLTETDTPLEEAVCKLLRTLGVQVEPGPSKRADLIALIGSTILCVEVKGYEGAAKEAAVGQCDRWVKEVEATFTQEVGERDESLLRYAEILKKLGIATPIGEGEPIPYAIKGAIIANTYRARPLDQRPPLNAKRAEHFAEPLQTRMRQQRFVGMTTMQLLGLFDDHRKAPEGTAARLSELASAAGHWAEYLDWSKFLLKDLG